MTRIVGIALLQIFLLQAVNAQKTVLMVDSIEQHIFAYNEIYSLEDPSGKLTVETVNSDLYSNRFLPSNSYYPINATRESVYWFKIKIKHPPHSGKDWVIEFFDQTIDEIEFYAPADDGTYHPLAMGDKLAFRNRFVWHKNFVVPIQFYVNREVTYLARVKSKQKADVLIVLRSKSWLFKYALDEYFSFGVFYGMILVFGFYNLLMFLAVREKYYLFYILYLLSVGLYEMSADGIGFQYLWPNTPDFNYYSSGIFLYLAASFALLFSSSVLNLRSDNNVFRKIFIYAFAARTVFLVLSLTVWPNLFRLRFVELFPFLAIYYTSFHYYFFKKYSPARFLIIAYTFVAFGIFYKVLQYFGIDWKPIGELSHYSLGFSFVIEMLMLSFAISDKIRLLRIEKDMAQEEKIEQLHENQRLKDNLNKTLEEQVRLKTAELEQKSSLIEEQYRQLEIVNHQLEAQSREIAEVNALLDKDNRKLKHDVSEAMEARALSKELSFGEFCKIHQDNEGWLKFLAELKWANGFECRKCNYTLYNIGRTPHSRRCTRCGYEESAIAYTLLQGTHLPIEKLLYLIFLIYNTQGTISSHKLSEVLGIRQSTCWSYSSRIKSLLKERHKAGLREMNGWSDIILEV